VSSARDDVLREAAQWAAILRRSGYPEAQVAPEYCIGGVVGDDGFFTQTVSVWAGPYKLETAPTVIRRAFNFVTFTD